MEEMCVLGVERRVHDVRAPALSVFNRIETFRQCGQAVTADRMQTFAERGWYCSGVDHALRCVNCKDTPGNCYEYLVGDCECAVEDTFKTPNFPSYIDSMEFCTNPPISYRHAIPGSLFDKTSNSFLYSNILERIKSFERTTTPRKVWPKIDLWAEAGYYMKRKHLFYSSFSA